jgi:hypothetical protein
VKLEEFGRDLLEGVLADAGAREEGEFRENIFTEEAVGYLVDADVCADPTVAYFRARGMKLNAWDIRDEEGSLDLFVTIFDSGEPCRKIPRSEIDEALGRCRNFLERALKGLWKELEPAAEAFEIAQRTHAMSDRLHRARLFLVTNGIAGSWLPADCKVGDLAVAHHVWDLERFYQQSVAGRVREQIRIPAEDLGGGFPCVRLTAANPVYDAYVGIIPGAVLAGLYARWGQRLLERNVRSFLQLRSSVNKGILRTVEDDPSMFLAYNNGISTTAEAADVEELGGNQVRIRGLANFQIVNGAQTTASLYEAERNRKVDLSAVNVQIKLTVLKDPEMVDTHVPRISLYANSQSKVNLSDFSANDPYHVRLETLSRVIWVPAERGKSTTKWYYERARGAYINDMNAAGGPGKRAFKAMYPKSQTFTKTQVAKYEMTWWCQPHVVSRGSEKNFAQFMTILAAERERKPEWLPDETYFKHLVAKGILFKECDRLVRRTEFAGWKANTVTYAVALLARLTSHRLDLDAVWERQALTETNISTLDELIQAVWSHINSPPTPGMNIGEWCKQPRCWDTLRSSTALVAGLEAELVDAGGPTVDRPIGLVLVAAEEQTASAEAEGQAEPRS